MSMIAKSISFDLPVPWTEGKFETETIGRINFLVGPNGSGKSMFAEALKSYLGNARILGTDRLSGMEHTSPYKNAFGDHFANGLVKNQFPYFKEAGKQGFGLDTIILLEERMDLRIQVEATLSDLFSRRISLEWDSGNLIARARLGDTGNSYRLDRDECHGIKELLVLLTHLYNDEYPYLIIDEPELNLHPQYQAFFMQEVRKIAGDPNVENTKKVIFLVTHSPFILNFRSVDDLKSVISFDLDHSIPKQLLDLDVPATERLSSLVPRLNVHHKQLFFSDNPIFVEGNLDAQLVGAMQEARGVSVAGAGSCIIDAGGCEEVNHYLELCTALGKKAYFLYDLDSLFRGNLRACVRSDGSVQSFLLTAGVGNDFSMYCGKLERKLTSAIDSLLAADPVPAPCSPLIAFLRSLGRREDWNGENWAKARIAVMTTISRNRDDMVQALSQTDVEEIEGRINKIIAALHAKNVFLLPGGTLERYLPSYTGDPYVLADDAKRKAVVSEIQLMADGMTGVDMEDRYGALYRVVCELPSKPSVDTEPVLREYVGNYIHELQSALVQHPSWQRNQAQEYMKLKQPAATKVFSIQELKRDNDKEFSAVVAIAEMLGQGKRFVLVDHKTNAGMGGFRIETA